MSFSWHGTFQTVSKSILGRWFQLEIALLDDLARFCAPIEKLNIILPRTVQVKAISLNCFWWWWCWFCYEYEFINSFCMQSPKSKFATTIHYFELENYFDYLRNQSLMHLYTAKYSFFRSCHPRYQLTNLWLDEFK